MTDPRDFEAPSGNVPPQGYPGPGPGPVPPYGGQAPYGGPPPYGGQPPHGYGTAPHLPQQPYDPAAPYGRHPRTGEPLSSKSKVTAGLLQLLGLLGFLGFGRIYIGQTGYGVAQLVVGLVTCGIGAFIWGIIDAIMIFTDQVRDTDNLPLRDNM